MTALPHMAGARGGPEDLGAWWVEETPSRDYPGIVTARIVTDCETVAEIAGAVVCGDWGRHQLHTNRAHLIAAAPDLLEALLLARDLFVNSESACAEICDAAIAKATEGAG